MEISLDIIKDKINENILYVLWVGTAFILSAGIFIGKNENEISYLQKTVKEQKILIWAAKDIIARHEWMVLDHEKRINNLENKK